MFSIETLLLNPQLAHCTFVVHFTQNLDPIIGKIPQYENLYIVTGLSSSGFEQGPMSGKLLADCIHDGKPSPILSNADPARQVTALEVFVD